MTTGSTLSTKAPCRFLFRSGDVDCCLLLVGMVTDDVAALTLLFCGDGGRCVLFGCRGYRTRSSNEGPSGCWSS